MQRNSEEFVHGKLILENNIFKNSYGDIHLIHLEYLENAVIRNNIFDKEFKIESICTGEVINENNIIK